MGKRRRATERKKVHPVVLGGAAVAIVCGVGVTAYAVVGNGGSGRDGDEKSVATGPPTAAEVRTTARAFLAAWEKGDAAGAAALTDDRESALTALTSYRKDARISEVRLTPVKQTARKGAKVPFKAAATVSYGGKKKPYAYETALTVVRRAADGRTLVDWRPTVLHPELRPGDRLVTGAAGVPPIKAVDRDGAPLTAAKYPSLGTVLDGLREKFGKEAGGKAGVELRVVRAEPEQGGNGKDGKDGEGSSAKKSDAEDTPDKTLLDLSPGTPGTLRTTISARTQAAAEKETAKRKQASVVVVKPSTGEILAVANSNPGGFNTAMQGSLAPGSTMKVITASMLLEKDLAGVDKKHPCPKYETYGGWKFQNDNKFKIKGGTFRASFARSCNTAFISQAKELKNDDLTRQAQDVFGLGRDNWSVGVPTFDGAVPVQSHAQMAASLIGQGGVRMNPLNMASVAATVESGTFRQPYLVAPDLDGRKLATAPRKMSSRTVSDLRDLMHFTGVSGTAAEPMRGLGSDSGAKTGSAEVDNQKKPNGWFTAYRGDVAAAAVVQAGGHGGDTAGPVVRAMLLAGR
ncbi:penicillin-binding transpeptidase domain-containing protein [Streptomyces silvensis]|uniref:Penicillin-binding protein n=1 Tax=Streptomyces silvensis TaxID=1765722 RepID=A0A0W7X9N6_9ACTN|nr:penicillin-binding transpeptidase domain-containing protein [Streptomyces silvensis]KUF19549.1 penicillin-binding protein [Streptomyces silvensis]